MNKVVLLSGGNLGDRKLILQLAFQKIGEKVGKIAAYSPIVESEAWGFESENNFLNQVLIVNTNQSAPEVLNRIHEIELELGRERKEEQWVSRKIDIDILFFNDEIMNSRELTIPHKHIQDRRFTLFALKLLMPDYIHPVLNKSINELLSTCKDKSKVEIYHA